MNLFILSLNVQECAQAMMDKHISKIIIEAVQMLSTCKRLLDPENVDEDIVYKNTHINHPVSKWVRESYENWLWTLDLITEMHKEWKFRYNHPESRIHKSFVVAMYLKLNPPPSNAFEKNDMTPFALAIPEQYKYLNDPVRSYREYYKSPEKQKIASWKNRDVPSWYK